MQWYHDKALVFIYSRKPKVKFCTCRFYSNVNSEQLVSHIHSKPLLLYQMLDFNKTTQSLAQYSEDRFENIGH